MRMQLMAALTAVGALAATDASAQAINLSGPYRCVVDCAGPAPAVVTQNGWDINLVNELGIPSRAWVVLAWSHLGAELERGRDLFAGWYDYPIRPWQRMAPNRADFPGPLLIEVCTPRLTAMGARRRYLRSMTARERVGHERNAVSGDVDRCSGRS